MFETWGNRRRLWRANRELAATSRLYDKIWKSKPDRSDHEEQMLYAEMRAEMAPLEERVEFWKTQILIQQAGQLGLPLPDKGEPNWVKQDHSRYAIILTAKGATELRREIRRERKERDEHLRNWASVVIPILSLIVAILALALRN